MGEIDKRWHVNEKIWYRAEQGSEVYRKELIFQNLKNASFNEWDQDFLKFAWKVLEQCFNNISRYDLV